LSAGQLRPLIVPVFIPNVGCPHRCLFCEQERITSQKDQFVNGEYVKNILDSAVRSRRFDLKRRPQVAFYGGTFTNLPNDLLVTLLEAVNPYIKQGLFHSIRVSTRPDAIEKNTLLTMKAYGVRTVELGAQSMDNDVLFQAGRGHTVEDTIKAVQCLKQHAFKVGIQLMPGLPGDSKVKFRLTTKKVMALKPDMVRLYPALVIRGTGLARLYREDRYRPLKLQNAVEICLEACLLFESLGIPVIRMGLMSSPTLLEDGQIVAGPWHPAFGFLVRSAMFHKNIEPGLPLFKAAAQIIIFVPPKQISLLRGYKNQGLKAIEDKTGAKVVAVRPDDSLSHGIIRIEKK
jgi:histone acetyltransferase (RNA polymerase elongator complex component)